MITEFYKQEVKKPSYVDGQKTPTDQKYVQVCVFDVVFAAS